MTVSSGLHRLCMRALRMESPFHLVLWKTCDQTLPGFIVKFSGYSSFRYWTPRFGSLVWDSEFSLEWLNCFPPFESSTLWVWNLSLLWLCPSYHLTENSFLSLDVGYLFLVDLSIFLLVVVQWWFWCFQKEVMSSCPTTLLSWANPESVSFAVVFMFQNYSLIQYYM